jgi:hypothetical protein
MTYVEEVHEASIVADSQQAAVGIWHAGTATRFGANPECGAYRDWAMPGAWGGAGTCNGYDGNSYSLYETTFFAAVVDSSPKLMLGPMCHCPCGQRWEHGRLVCTRDKCQQDIPICAQQGSCDRCIEITCRSNLRGDREACFRDRFRSIVVRVTSACPAYHPQNPAGTHCTKRMQQDWNAPAHIDVGCAAMQNLADLRFGEWQIDYRYVDCAAGIGYRESPADDHACWFDGWRWLCPQGTLAPTCTDVAPNADYTCEQQRAWGKCDAQWMIGGAYCARTCNRCT